MATLRSQDGDNLGLCHPSPSLGGIGPDFGKPKCPSPVVGLGLFFYQSLLIKKIKYLSLFFSLTGSVSTSYGQEMEILPNHKQHRKILLVVTVTRRWPMEIRQSPLPSLSKNLSSDSQRRAGGEKGMERTQSNCS